MPLLPYLYFCLCCHHSLSAKTEQKPRTRLHSHPFRSCLNKMLDRLRHRMHTFRGTGTFKHILPTTPLTCICMAALILERRCNFGCLGKVQIPLSNRPTKP